MTTVHGPTSATRFAHQSLSCETKLYKKVMQKEKKCLQCEREKHRERERARLCNAAANFIMDTQKVFTNNY